MEERVRLEAVKNNIISYSNMLREYNDNIEMLRSKLKTLSYHDKLYRVIDDELDEMITQAAKIRDYIDSYKNYLKEHEHECYINEVDKTRPIPKA